MSPNEVEVEKTFKPTGKGLPQVSDDTCPQCGGQLCVNRSSVMMPSPSKGGLLVREGSARDKRQSWVGCSVCDLPVSLNHPRQVKLDKEWEALEAKEKEEAKRAAKQPVPKAEPINPVMDVFRLVESLVDTTRELRKDLEAALKRISTLEQTVAELKGRRK